MIPIFQVQQFFLTKFSNPYKHLVVSSIDSRDSNQRVVDGQKYRVVTALEGFRGRLLRALSHISFMRCFNSVANSMKHPSDELDKNILARLKFFSDLRHFHNEEVYTRFVDENLREKPGFFNYQELIKPLSQREINAFNAHISNIEFAGMMSQCGLVDPSQDPEFNNNSCCRLS